MKSISIAIFVSFLNIFHVNGQKVELNDNCKDAYQNILALRFNAAHQKLEAEKEINPNNLFVPYLENYIDFLTVFISEDEEQFDWLEDNKSKRINTIKKLSDTSRFKKYMLGNIYLQWAVARLKFKEYITAAIEINKAYRLLEANAEEFPAFVPNNISLGVLHVMIGMVPEKYQWLLNIISMKGSVEEGRRELEYVLEESNRNETYHYLRTETLFYLGFIDLNIKPNAGQLAFLLSELALNRKGNLLLSYLSINILMRTGKNDSALFVFDENMEPDGYYPFYYLKYLSGECHLRKLDGDGASKDYHVFLSNFNGRNYVGDAWRKVGWSALIRGDSATYRNEMNKVIEFGNDDVDIDKEAKKEANAGIVPNTELIKTRLLFDGGYYIKADSVLNEISMVSLHAEEKIEWYYRRARVAHELGNIGQAKSYYNETIEIGSWSDRYYAGNSCLKLGGIYEMENNKTKAIYYYNLCSDLKFDEYENSIHAKAKAGLERVNAQD
jgi:hypothetical protein